MSDSTSPIYVIKKKGKFVARPGGEKSYTTILEKAVTFRTYEEAKANACDDEQVYRLDFDFE